MRLQYKTRDNSLPQGKPMVYFCCHPDDFDLHFTDIADEILSKQNCVIWYSNENPVRDEDFFAALERMQLFVVPITFNFLNTYNDALEIDFKFAMEHHIPVLPLMQTNGLESLFNKKCGDLQFLDKHNTDATAICYADKLQKFLDSVLISDQLAAKIRAAFDAYVFLSYRKKDRKQAQKLMRLIHRHEFCRDIAIWYDEFLTPGENFNDAIKTAIQKSGLFVLTVTPNLVNESNYVMTTEYPMAKQEGKAILPVEMIPTDREQLVAQYVDIPTPTDAYNAAALSDALLEALQKIAIRENDHSPAHNFFIGLAYLGGVDVEVNHTRALELIRSAADAGLPEAMEQLAQMYEKGQGVERNYPEAIRWRQAIARNYEDIIKDLICNQQKLMDKINQPELDANGRQTRESLEVNYERSKTLKFMRTNTGEKVKAWNLAQAALSALYHTAGDIPASKETILETIAFAEEHTAYYSNDVSFVGVLSGQGNAINTSYFDLFLMMADYYAQEKNYEESKAWLAKADNWLQSLQDDSNNKLLKLQLRTQNALLLKNAQDYKEANLRLAQIKEEYTKVLNGKDFVDVAILYANEQSAIFAPLRDVQILHAEVLMHLGAYEEAIETYLDALRGNERSAEKKDDRKELLCLLQLSSLYMLTGQTDKADTYLTNAETFFAYHEENGEALAPFCQESFQFRRDLLSGDWQESFFHPEILPFDRLYLPEERIRQAIIFPYGGFESQDTAEKLLLHCLTLSIDSITEWFSTAKRRRLAINFEFDYTIGYTISEPTESKIPSSRAMLTLRRDRDNVTRYGFFVSSLNVL